RDSVDARHDAPCGLPWAAEGDVARDWADGSARASRDGSAGCAATGPRGERASATELAAVGSPQATAARPHRLRTAATSGRLITLRSLHIGSHIGHQPMRTGSVTM